ncbi:MAG: hypothetical protein FWE57_03715 [Chitinispirillia bacterium]|nr:hypothetical protein [Chitinispirillia bacterium]
MNRSFLKKFVAAGIAAVMGIGLAFVACTDDEGNPIIGGGGGCTQWGDAVTVPATCTQTGTITVPCLQGGAPPSITILDQLSGAACDPNTGCTSWGTLQVTPATCQAAGQSIMPCLSNPVFNQVQTIDQLTGTQCQAVCNPPNFMQNGVCAPCAAGTQWNGFQCAPQNTSCNPPNYMVNGICGPCVPPNYVQGSLCAPCPVGQQWNGAFCDGGGGTQCFGGQVLTGGACVCPSNTPVWNGQQCHPCPAGQTWNGTACTGGGTPGGQMCLYNTGDCWPMESETARQDCISFGWIFNGGTEGPGTYCAGGAFSGIGRNQTPVTPGGTIQMCLWNTGACWPIDTPADRTECTNYGWIFNGGAEGEDTYCAGGAFSGIGRNQTPVTPGAVIQMCLWSSGDCWPIDTPADRTECTSFGWIFNGGTEGSGTYCAGGAFSGTGRSTTPATPGSVLDMCLWPSCDCWPIDNAAEMTECVTNGWVFAGGTEGTGSLCAGGTFTGRGQSTTPPTSIQQPLGCCEWNPGVCWTVHTQTQVTDCGTNLRSRSACPVNNGTCSGL